MASEPTTTWLGVLKFVAWRIITVVAIGLFVVTLWFGISPLLALASPVVIMILFPELAGMSTRVRRQRGTMILSYLEQAVRLNLPLPGMLSAARQSETGVMALRLLKLQKMLETGASVETALRLEAPEVSRRVVSLIGAAERSGQLPQALARVIDEEQESPEQAERSAFGRWYPLMMTLVLVGVTMMIMIFVVPKIEEIFKDFGLRLPATTLLLMNLSRGIFQADLFDIPVLLIVIIVIAVLMLGGLFERIWTQPQELPRPAFLDYLAWATPVWHGVVRDRGMADACDTIAGALRGGQPLHRAIEEATQISMNEIVRQRLRDWQAGVEAGQAADEAARVAKLPPLLCGMIGTGRGTDPTAAVEFLAAYYHGRFSRSREVIRSGAVPMMALLFGGVVLFVASGLFTPLISLIDSVSVSTKAVRK